MTRSSSGTPAADVEVDAALVRRLLVAQHPDLAELPIEPFNAGWDNAMFRLGTALAVRLPRRAAAVPLLTHEQRWLPALSPRLPIAIAAPVRIGRPGDGYPWHWSVVPWLPGTAADIAPPDEDQAEPLAFFLTCLHVAPPPDAPRSEVRGVPLSKRAAVVEDRLRRLQAKTTVVTKSVWEAWREALEVPWDGEATWIHGDLHARNVLVEDGSITGVIDWGDITSGDKATDLASIWMLLPSAASRRRAMEAYPDRSEELWARARGWAILFGALLLDTGLQDHPRHARMGELTMRRVAGE